MKMKGKSSRQRKEDEKERKARISEIINNIGDALPFGMITVKGHYQILSAALQYILASKSVVQMNGVDADIGSLGQLRQENLNLKNKLAFVESKLPSVDDGSSANAVQTTKPTLAPKPIQPKQNPIAIAKPPTAVITGILIPKEPPIKKISSRTVAVDTADLANTIGTCSRRPKWIDSSEKAGSENKVITSTAPKSKPNSCSPVGIEPAVERSRTEIERNDNEQQATGTTQQRVTNNYTIIVHQQPPTLLAKRRRFNSNRSSEPAEQATTPKQPVPIAPKIVRSTSDFSTVQSTLTSLVPLVIVPEVISHLKPPFEGPKQQVDKPTEVARNEKESNSNPITSNSAVNQSHHSSAVDYQGRSQSPAKNQKDPRKTANTTSNENTLARSKQSDLTALSTDESSGVPVSVSSSCSSSAAALPANTTENVGNASEPLPAVAENIEESPLLTVRDIIGDETPQKESSVNDIDLLTDSTTPKVSESSAVLNTPTVTRIGTSTLASLVNVSETLPSSRHGSTSAATSHSTIETTPFDVDSFVGKKSTPTIQSRRALPFSTCESPNNSVNKTNKARKFSSTKFQGSPGKSSAITLTIENQNSASMGIPSLNSSGSRVADKISSPSMTISATTSFSCSSASTTSVPMSSTSTSCSIPLPPTHRTHNYLLPPINLPPNNPLQSHPLQSSYSSASMTKTPSVAAASSIAASTFTTSSTVSKPTTASTAQLHPPPKRARQFSSNRFSVDFLNSSDSLQTSKPPSRSVATNSVSPSNARSSASSKRSSGIPTTCSTTTSQQSCPTSSENRKYKTASSSYSQQSIQPNMVRQSVEPSADGNERRLPSKATAQTSTAQFLPSSKSVTNNRSPRQSNPVIISSTTSSSYLSPINNYAMTTESYYWKPPTVGIETGIVPPTVDQDINLNNSIFDTVVPPSSESSAMMTCPSSSSTSSAPSSSYFTSNTHHHPHHNHPQFPFPYAHHHPHQHYGPDSESTAAQHPYYHATPANGTSGWAPPPYSFSHAHHHQQSPHHPHQQNQHQQQQQHHSITSSSLPNEAASSFSGATSSAMLLPPPMPPISSSRSATNTVIPPSLTDTAPDHRRILPHQSSNSTSSNGFTFSLMTTPSTNRNNNNSNQMPSEQQQQQTSARSSSSKHLGASSSTSNSSGTFHIANMLSEVRNNESSSLTTQWEHSSTHRHNYSSASRALHQHQQYQHHHQNHPHHQSSHHNPSTIRHHQNETNTSDPNRKRSSSSSHQNRRLSEQLQPILGYKPPSPPPTVSTSTFPPPPPPPPPPPHPSSYDMNNYSSFPLSSSSSASAMVVDYDYNQHHPQHHPSVNRNIGGGLIHSSPSSSSGFMPNFNFSSSNN